MTISDTLFEAISEIDEYLSPKYPIDMYSGIKDEIRGVVLVMLALQHHLDEQPEFSGNLRDKLIEVLRTVLAGLESTNTRGR